LFVEGAVDLEELADQLTELPANYVRIKGIVRDASGQWYAIHRVGLRVSSEPIVRKPDDGLGEHGRIVALGSDLESEKVARCLEAAYLR
jgi:G3E family GTPase